MRWQRATSAARRTPLLAAFPKIVFPFLAIWPGLAALTFVHLSANGPLTQSYNMAIPYAMAHFYPSGLLGVGLVALIASFMSGQAGNVSAFNTIWTYDIYKSYIRPQSSDKHLVWMGRLDTVAGTLIAVGTAYWVRSFSTIINYEQLIFSIINAPLLAAVLLGMFWKRTTAKGAFIGLSAGERRLAGDLLYPRHQLQDRRRARRHLLAGADLVGNHDGRHRGGDTRDQAQDRRRA